MHTGIAGKMVRLLLVAAFLFCIPAATFPVQAASPGWTKDSQGPVFSRGMVTGAPCILYDNTTGKYQMWYTRATADVSRLEALIKKVKTAGLNLGTLVQSLKAKKFREAAGDVTALRNLISFLADNSTGITRCFQGTHSYSGYATSTDGVNWVDKGLVLLPGPVGTWDHLVVGAPSVIHDNTTGKYRMWYTGATADPALLEKILDNLSDLASGNIDTLISRISNLQLDQSLESLPQGFLDSIITNCIAFIDSVGLSIGYAESTDGMNWTKLDRPVVKGSNDDEAWDRFGAATPSVVHDETGYRMWYTGIKINAAGALVELLNNDGSSGRTRVSRALATCVEPSIGYATSTDGIAWTKASESPVFRKGEVSAWDSWCVAAPSIVRNIGGIYEMWYTGASLSPAALLDFLRGKAGLESAMLSCINIAIGHAESPDGKVWTRDSIPVLTRSPSGSWDGCAVGFPAAMYDVSGNGTTRIWYTGAEAHPGKILGTLLNGGSLESAVAGSKTGIGYAYAPKALRTISVTPNQYALPVGRTYRYTAWGIYSDGSTANLTSAVTWSSTVPDRAVVGAGGVAAAKSQGYTWISAASGDVTGNALLEIVAPELERIQISPSGVSLPCGQARQFTASGIYSDNTTADLTSVATWSSNDESVATVAGGLAVGKKAGTARISACYQGVSSFETLTVGPAVAKGLVISPDNPTVPAGLTVQLHAIQQFTDGAMVDVTADAAWSSSSNTTATVSKGLVTALTPGTSNITAAYCGYSDNVTLTVISPVPQSVEIVASSDNVVAGKQLQLELHARYSDNSTHDITTDNSTIWLSLNPLVATVSRTGLLTSLTSDNVTIRAINHGVQGDHIFTVLPHVLEAIAVTPANLTTTAGCNVQFTATGNYSDNATGDITRLVRWQSDNQTVATIISGSDNAGLATPLAYGLTVISANLAGICGSTTLNVVQDELLSLSVSPSAPSIARGMTQQFTATGEYRIRGTVDVTPLVSWGSNNSTAATIGLHTGLARGLCEGTTTITAALSGKSDIAFLTVGKARLETITVTPESACNAKGRNVQFAATGKYSDNSTKTITTEVEWTSSNESAATIGLHTGLAVCTGQGTATITAELDGRSGNATLMVTAAELVSIRIEPSTSTVAAGRTRQFTAWGMFSDNLSCNITSSAVWSSNETGIASVSSSGLATSYRSGAATITAARDGKTGSATLTVTEAVLDTLTITPSSATILVGASQQFQAEGAYSDNSQRNVTASANWTSDNGTIATVISSGENTGLVTGHAPGVASIKATLGGASVEATLTVTAAHLVSITVGPQHASVAAGRSQQFTASGNFSDNSTYELTNSVTWTSSDNTIAKVNSLGLANTYLPGDVTITVTCSNISGSATLSVSSPEVDAIAVTPLDPTLSLVSGSLQSLQFTATAIFSDGAAGDITASAAWGSSQHSVATIEASGLATIAGAGTCNITAEKDGKRASVTLTVLPDIIPPRVMLDSPTDGTVTGCPNITLAGKVDDKNAAVSYFLNGQPGVSLELDTAGGFSTGLLLQTGRNSLRVDAVDRAGNTGSTGTVTVTVKCSSPTITIISPREEAVVRDQSITVTGTITGATTANMTVNNIAQAITPVGGIFSASANLTEGPNIIVVTAYSDNHSGDPDYLGTSGVRRVILDTRPPVVTITSPVPGSVTSTPGIRVTGRVDDATVQTATLLVNGLPRTIAVVERQFNQDITLVQGINTIQVIAADQVGNSATSSVTVTLDSSRPEVVVDTPVNGLVTNTGSQTVAGRVNDPSISRATLCLNGSPQDISVVSGGSFNTVVPLRNGVNTISVCVTAASGQTGMSGNITVTLDTAKPHITVGLRDPKETVTITALSDEILARSPEATVNQVSEVNMVPVGMNWWEGVYGSLSDPVAPGQYTVLVKGRDEAGNEATANATFSKTIVNTDGIHPTMVINGRSSLTVETNGAVSGAAISMTQHTANPSGIVAPADNVTPLGIFIRIVASPELNSSLKRICITVPYDESAVSENIDESTLTFYLWDVEFGRWLPVEDSCVDTEHNLITACFAHLSEYGIFGKPLPPAPPPPPPPPPPPVISYGGGGGFMEPPSISNIAAEGVARNEVYIRWTTNRSSTSQVEYITNQSGTSQVESWAGQALLTPLDSALVFQHEVRLTGLKSATSYSYRVISQDSTGNEARSEVQSFTTQGSPATFNVTSLVITPARVNTGENITFSVRVTNVGDIEGTCDVKLQINRVAVATKQVKLAAGASQEVSFTRVLDVAGAYPIDISSQSGTVYVQAPAPPPPEHRPLPASFVIRDLTVSPGNVIPGKTATVRFVVTNSGETAGTYRVDIRVGGTVASTEEITLDGGASREIHRDVSRDTPGSYSVAVGELVASFTVEKAPVEPVVNWRGGIASVLIIYLALLAIVILVARRYRK